MNRRQILASVPLWFAQRRAGAQAGPDGVWLPDVRVVDQDGRTHQLVSGLIAERPVILSFFFAGCRTVCPPQTAILLQTRQRLAVRLPDLLVVSMTVDPLSDGPVQMRAFASRFAVPLGSTAGWTLVACSGADLNKVYRALGQRASATPDQHPDGYWLRKSAQRPWQRLPGLSSPEQLAAAFV